MGFINAPIAFLEELLTRFSKMKETETALMTTYVINLTEAEEFFHSFLSRRVLKEKRSWVPRICKVFDCTLTYMSLTKFTITLK